MAASVAQARSLLALGPPSLVLFGDRVAERHRLEILETLERARPSIPFAFLSECADVTRLAPLIRWRDGQDVSAEAAAAAPVPLLDDEVLTATLRALVTALDSRDPYNGEHSRRVCEWARKLGTKLGLAKAELDLLGLAGLLHDIGKLHVPAEILSKPGKLTDDEWAIMRRHPVYGAEIVSEVEALRGVATIIRHHHERVDGAGYPDGIAGDAIPPFSRLLSIVDAYEAMISNRSYRSAMPESAAREVLAAGMGTQFDSEIGGAFLSLVAD